MKGSEWRFTRLIPDREDLAAEAGAWADLEDKIKNSQVRIEELDPFSCGFVRGMAWAIAKYGIKEG